MHNNNFSQLVATYYLDKYNYLISRLKLKAATGSLAEDELALVNQALH